MTKKILSFCSLICLAVGVHAAVDLKKGEEKYEKHCKVCHSPQMSAALHSPTVHDSSKWMPFIKKAVLESTKNKSTDCAALTKGTKDSEKLTPSDADLAKLSVEEKACYLLPKAITGVQEGAKVMPPKGTCMDCTNDELLSAIAFMNKEK